MEWLSVIASFINYLWQYMPIEPKDVFKKIVKIIAGFSSAVSLLKCVCEVDLVVLLLRFLQDYRIWFYAGICCLAEIPGITAYFERKKDSEAIKKSYVWQNALYNFVGAGCAVVIIETTYKNIKNFRFLEDFYVGEIVLSLLPLFVWIAFSYQYAEQQKDLQDHSPSLEWKNQILNILHLIDVYFWSLISAELLICYTLYCYIHHAPIELDGWYLFSLSIVLIFFYICGVHEQYHLYLLFLTAVPAILLYIIQWLSWFEIDREALHYQVIFIIVHFIVYLFIVFRRERNTSIRNLIFGVLLVCGVAHYYIYPISFGWTLGCFTVILILLYLCGTFWRNTFYLLFLSGVPAVLICADRYMSGSAMEVQTLQKQAVFFSVHFAVYMLVIILKEKNVNWGYMKSPARLIAILRSKISRVASYVKKFIRVMKERPDETKKEMKERLPEVFVLGEWFFGVVFILMVIGYPIFCSIPYNLDRLPYGEAANYIEAICGDIEEAKVLRVEVENCDWYDDSPTLQNPDVDQRKYLMFLYDNLRDKMVEKSIISKDDVEVSYQQVVDWYKGYRPDL